ncbi:uncharacterized protein [Panulirus ornatus]|uniref:uncharacterized protein isoform X2 n=1 Tax=Panulirus ornatus TaxID=150431 RepID=UPI003A83F27E
MRGCAADGAVFAEGSAMASPNECSYCFCIRGRRRCVAPKCLLPVEGCRPRYRSFSCCPTFYDCHDATSTTTTTTKPEECEVEGKIYEEGSQVEGVGTACQTCFCLQGKVTCRKLACADPIDGCTPIMQEGQCCPVMYDCGGEVTPDQIALLLKAKAGNQQSILPERKSTARMSPGGEVTITDTGIDRSPGAPPDFASLGVDLPQTILNEAATIEVPVTVAAPNEEETTEDVQDEDMATTQENPPPTQKPPPTLRPMARPSLAEIVKLRQQSRFSSRRPKPTRIFRENQNSQTRSEAQSLSYRLRNRGRINKHAGNTAKTTSTVSTHTPTTSATPITSELPDILSVLSTMTTQSHRHIILPVPTTDEPTISITDEVKIKGSTKSRTASKYSTSTLPKYRYSATTTTPKPSVIPTVKPRASSTTSRAAPVITTTERKVESLPEVVGVGHVGEAFLIQNMKKLTTIPPRHNPPIFNWEKNVEVGTGVNVKGSLDDTMAFGPILIFNNRVRTDRQTKDKNETENATETATEKEEEETAVTNIPPEDTTMLTEDDPVDDLEVSEEPIKNMDTMNKSATISEELTTLLSSLIFPESTITPQDNTSTTTQASVTITTMPTKKPSSALPSVSEISPTDDTADTEDTDTVVTNIETDLPSYDITVGTSVLATDQEQPGPVGVGEVIPIQLEPEHKEPETEAAPEVSRPSLLGTLFDIFTRPERPPTRLERPSTRPERPHTRLERPITRTEKPLTRPERPLTRPERPPTRLDRPPTRLERPPTRLERPSSQPERPHTRTERPAAQSDTLLTRQERPSNRPERLPPRLSFRPRPRPDSRPEFIPPRFRFTPAPTPTDKEVTTQPSTSGSTQEQQDLITSTTKPLRFAAPTSQTDITPSPIIPAIIQPSPVHNQPKPIHNQPITLINLPDPIHTRPAVPFNRPSPVNNQPAPVPEQPGNPQDLPSEPIIESGFLGIRSEGIQPNFDFNSDYENDGEPTLPPSLPNLKIIPFVAADALTKPKIGFNSEDLRSTPQPLVPILVPDPDEDTDSNNNETLPNQAQPDTSEASPTTTTTTAATTTPRIFSRLPIGDRRPPILPPRRTFNRPSSTESSTRRPFLPFRRPEDRPTRLPFITQPAISDITTNPPETSSTQSATSSQPNVPYADREHPGTRPPFIPPRRQTSTRTTTTESTNLPKITTQPLQLPSVIPPSPKPTITTSTRTSRPILSNDISNLLLQDVFELPEGQNTQPVRFTSSHATSKPIVPVKVATVLPEIPPAVRDQLPLATDPVLASGLLKLSGCNIYGRMYVVKDRIPELSAKCKECRCTPVGVQCLPIC